MNNSVDKMASPDYGLDAPKVVRNLLIIGVIGILLWASAALGIWSGDIVLGPIGGIVIRFPAIADLCWGIAFFSTGVTMVWSSRVGKVRKRERLLDVLMLTGNEQVLDVGCGRGLMLIAAAKRLTSGKAIGIDKWQQEDLLNNRPEATLQNARLEKVADRVEVKTADMRELPFADESFDVVLSCAAIHNINGVKERAKAINEIARVLKPGGRALIDDIRHLEEYLAAFARAGCIDSRRIGSPLVTIFWTAITMGSLRPGTISVQKPIQR
jgi:SAM-dependent methyltransferase